MTAADMRAGHPLAHKSGVEMLNNVLLASRVWRGLTKPQRELLLSSVAGCPILARADVVDRLVRRGLINAADGVACEATDAGRFVVAWRTP